MIQWLHPWPFYDLLVNKDMNVNEHDRLFNITLRHKSK